MQKTLSIMKQSSALLFFLLMLASGVVLAQRPQKPDPDAMTKRAVDRMTQELKLEKPAQDSLTVIYKDFYTEMAKSYESNDRAKFKELSEKRDEKIKKILTPEQNAKFKELKGKKPQRPRTDGEKPEGDHPEPVH